MKRSRIARNVSNVNASKYLCNMHKNIFMKGILFPYRSVGTDVENFESDFIGLKSGFNDNCLRNLMPFLRKSL